MKTRRKLRNPRKMSRHNPFTRKRGGGAKNLWNIFKYTSRKERVLWVKHLYKYGNLLTQEIAKIPWKDYNYKGKTLMQTEIDGERLGDAKSLEEKLPIHATSQTVPYYITGGAACEIWNKEYPDAAKLHKTTDSTADIDIVLAPPYFEIEDDTIDYDFQARLLTKDGEYTALSDHYTRWVFDNAVQIAESITPHFAKHIFETPELEDTYETMNADLHKKEGSFLITRAYGNDMIKIQITTKLSLKGMNRTDHIVEFILPTKEVMIDSSKNQYKSSTTNISGVFVENVFNLILSQGKAVSGRMNIEPEIQYKLVNHFGRLLYLSKLLRYLLDRGIQPVLSEYQLRRITDFVTNGLFTPKEDICMPKNGCSEEEFLNPLKPYINMKSATFKALREYGFEFR